MKGVKKGYRHYWRYSASNFKEIKIGPKNWIVRWGPTIKTNMRKHTGKGGPQRGTKIKWRLSGTQTAIKINPRQYRLYFKGRKRLISARIKRKRYK